jgi:hypothetical protein
MKKPKRAKSALCTAVGALLVVTAAPTAAAAAPAPPRGSASYEWPRSDCSMDANDRFWAVGKVVTHLHWLPDAKNTYYQHVTVQIDRLALGHTWRTMESKKYDWSRVKRKDVPTYSTSAVRAAVGATIANGGELSAKVHVQLKQVRTGPDKVVWEYTNRTANFSCSLDF